MHRLTAMALLGVLFTAPSHAQLDEKILTFDLVLRPGEIRVFEAGFDPNVADSKTMDQDTASISWINFAKGFPQMVVHATTEGVTEAVIRSKSGGAMARVTIVVKNSKARPRSDLPETPLIRDFPEKNASEIQIELGQKEKRDFSLGFEPYFEPVVGNPKIAKVTFAKIKNEKSKALENTMNIQALKTGQTDILVRSIDGALQMRFAITVKKAAKAY